MRVTKHFTLCVLLLAVCAMAGGCVKQVTKQDRFAGMYEEQPKSILVLPAMNNTTAADAKKYYMTTVTEPLANYGYYVYPMPVVMEIMQHEGLYDTEMIYEMPVHKFGEHFGADCVLFTKITDWDTVYYVIGGHMTVGFDSELRSTKTDRVLWKYHGQVVIDLGGGSGNLFVDVVITAVKALTIDYVPYARLANYQTFNTMPYGPHSPIYMQDGEVKLIDQGAIEATATETE